MNLFGRKKAQPTVTPQQAIQGLANEMNVCEKRNNLLDRQKEASRLEFVKRMKAKDKLGAMRHLRSMKSIEKEQASLNGKMFNLDSLKRSLESAATNQQYVNTLKAAQSVSKAIVGDKQVEEVQDLNSDMQDQFRQIDEMQTALSEPIASDGLTDDDLEAEFRAQMEAEAETQPDILAGFVDVPAKVPEQRQQQVAAASRVQIAQTGSSKHAEKDELKQLQLEMGL